MVERELDRELASMEVRLAELGLRFDRYLGTSASRVGALALALSPAAVFYGRYAIHESWMALSLMITAWGILGLWKTGERRDLVVTISGVTLLLLIKETAVIHLLSFLAAAGVLVLWERFSPTLPTLPFSRQRWGKSELAWCCGLSLMALVFFYSGTFFNFPGVEDFFRAYAKWFHTGTGDTGHVKGEYQIGGVSCLNYYWLALIGRYEWPALLGLIYALRLAWPVKFPGSPIARYLAIYGIGTFVAYSVVPYKTPWCIISIIWPFALLFGCAVKEWWGICKKMPGYAESRVGAMIIAALIPVFLLGVSLCTTLELNFHHFADPAEPYVYVQTMPEIDFVTKPVLGLAARDARNYGMSGQILLDSYYPLPWMFGDFTGIGYYEGTNIPAVLDGDFIVALTSQQKMVETRIHEPYLRRRFHLRDSMDECTVWFKESLFRDWFEDRHHGEVEKIIPAKP